MRTSLLSFALVAALTSLATGCAPAAEETESVDATESDYSVGPDGLVRWLGTNHSVRYMGQFLDWRPGATTPFLVAPRPEQAQPGGLAFPAAVFESPEVESMMKIAREADRLALPITVGRPEEVVLPDLICAAPAGVHVYSGRPAWLDSVATLASTPEQRAALDAAAGATTEVLIALPGDDLSAPMIRLAFGIVNRPQSAQPGANVASYWTILGATLGEARCSPRTRPVFSLSSRNDNLLTINADEKNALLSGGAWKEQIKPGREGFEIGVADGPGRVGIYRCFYPSSGLHFFSQSATCEGGTNEGILGFAAQSPTTDASRSLRRCLQTYNQYTHVLGGECQAGARDDGILGWVP